MGMATGTHTEVSPAMGMGTHMEAQAHATTTTMISKPEGVRIIMMAHTGTRRQARKRSQLRAGRRAMLPMPTCNNSSVT